MFSYTDSSFYTTDHEWVMFEGIVAYMGICPFKLTGIDKIDKIEFADLSAKLEKGSCLATIHSDDYQIKVHMPVDGWVIESNIRSVEDPSYIRQDIRSGWIAKIRPVAPYSREGLLRAEEYKQKLKKKVRA
jgi:glycine cleavage system H protein